MMLRAEADDDQQSWPTEKCNAIPLVPPSRAAQPSFSALFGPFIVSVCLWVSAFYLFIFFTFRHTRIRVWREGSSFFALTLISLTKECIILSVCMCSLHSKVNRPGFLCVVLLCSFVRSAYFFFLVCCSRLMHFSARVLCDVLVFVLRMIIVIDQQHKREIFASAKRC